MIETAQTKVVRAAAWSVLILVVLVVVGVTVGGVIYGPRLARALTGEATQKSNATVAQAEVGMEQRAAVRQSEVQAAEVTVHLQTQEAVRELQIARGAQDLIPVDAYDAWLSGVQLNRSRQNASGPGTAGPVSDPGTSETE